MENKGSRKMKGILSILLVAVMIALTTMVAVNDLSSNIAQAATKPTISKTTRNILIGKKYNLNINNKIAKSKYKWTSSNEKIATVDNRGIVTARSKGVVDIACIITAPKAEYRVSCKVTVREPATVFRISNKISALNRGQEYDLNRVLGPKSSNDKTTWTTSDASIAKPDSLGKFTALKEGKVTITGTTMSGKSDSVTIMVVDKEGTVTNQKELDDLVGSGAELITIKTDEELEFSIRAGKYLNQTLVVDAPNADVKNYGVFKSIEIKQIKGDTWYERAVGNLLKILDKDIGIEIASFASASIEVNEDKVVLRIKNNGIIEEIVINKEADIELTGNSDEGTAVVVNAPNIKIKTSVPLNLISNAKFDLEVLPGGEGTTIKAANKDVVPTIKSNVDIKVEIDGEEETVAGTPVPTQAPSGGGGGGGGGGGTPKPTPSPQPGEYRLEKDLNQVASVTVKYLGMEFTIGSEIINELIGFLDDEAETVETWKATTNTTKTYGGMEVRVSGTAGELTKKVEFMNGLLSGRSYDVTVNPNAKSVTLQGSSQTFTVQKLDARSIKITPAPSTNDLTFSFTYK